MTIPTKLNTTIGIYGIVLRTRNQTLKKRKNKTKQTVNADKTAIKISRPIQREQKMRARPHKKPAIKEAFDFFLI